jgi:hypothetical protein
MVCTWPARFLAGFRQELEEVLPVHVIQKITKTWSKPGKNLAN